MTTKAKEKTEKVLKINHGEEVDEVFLYTDDPDINHAVYVKPGTYKEPEAKTEAKQEG